LKHGLFDKLVYSKIRAGMGGRVEAAISGGAPLGVRLGHFYRGIGISVLEGYGLTETTAGATLNLHGAHRVGSVGRPIPGTSIKIAEDGEVLIRGPIVMDGYWQNQAANDEVFDSERWFKSGDLGKLDDDGFLYIVGRKKELIVTAGGKNVAPAVLEDRLRALLWLASAWLLETISHLSLRWSPLIQTLSSSGLQTTRRMAHRLQIW
jgi:long-chain acyl-CoA synthetase